MTPILRLLARPALLWGAFVLSIFVALSPVRAQNVPSSVAVLPGSYQLTPGDVLNISVLGHSDFTSSATIAPDGMISVIGAGKVQASGLTVDQLTDKLTTGLHRQILHPLVTVLVTETHPRQVSILGQGVHAPNVYSWRPGLTLLEALAASGGAVQAPELTDCLLISNQTTRVIDLVKLIEEGDQSQNIPLQPGDIVLMSPRDPAKAFVQVVGQVTHAGPVQVQPGGATIVSVLNLAGGAAPLAALSRVQLQHGTEVRTLNLHSLLFDINDAVGQTRVVAGDVVNVPLNNNHIQVYGEVNVPGELLIPDGEALTVTRALALCKTTNRDADQRAVGVVRRDTSGRDHLYKVNAQEVLKGSGKAHDMILQPDDKIVVPKRHGGFTAIGALQSALGAAFGLKAAGSLLH